jgi:hypothetical protein
LVVSQARALRINLHVELHSLCPTLQQATSFEEDNGLAGAGGADLPDGVGAISVRVKQDGVAIVFLAALDKIATDVDVVTPAAVL